MEPLVISITLLVIAVILIALELVIPSGGVIGIMAALAIIAAIIAAFFDGPRTGAFVLVGTVVSLPLLIWLGFKIWPYTPIGRKIMGQPPRDDEVVDREQVRSLNSRIGQQGTAKSKMLPSGVVIIDDQTFDSISEGFPVEQGDKIEVVAVRMNRLVVRKVLDEQVATQTSTAEDDVLNRPIDSLGLDPLDDPLA